MAEIKTQKVKLLKIWEILNRQSDEQHPLSTQDVISELKKFGITCDRRTVYGDITAMQSNGYSIMNRRRGHDMVYWVQQRQFALPELKIIMDAIQSCKFIPSLKTKELLDKIASLGGSESTHLLMRNTVRFNTVKLSNDDIYTIIDNLERAIEDHKRISFTYYDLDESGKRVYRHDNKHYEEEPLAMICDDGNYYLLCYRPEPEYANHVKIFRADRISDISILEKQVSKEGANAIRTITNYPKQVFKMYGGNIRKVRLLFDGNLIGVVFNKFGETTNIKKCGSRYSATVEVQISPVFWGWLMQFPTQMEVLSPSDIRTQFIEWIQAAANTYSERE